MEQKIDELLKQLHKYLFADSEQVVNELRIYLLDETLKEADLGNQPHPVLINHILYSIYKLENIQLEGLFPRVFAVKCLIKR